MPGHIAITVGSTVTELIVDPNSYSETDIVDFAPRAVSGTPAFSELGLYLDVAQEAFSHGFGQWRFAQPANYSFTGDNVDTRHKGITLMTEEETLFNVGSSWRVTKLIDQGGTVVMADSVGLSVVRPSNNAYASFTNLGGAIRDLMSNGKYFFMSRSGRMKLGFVGTVSARAGDVVTVSGADFEDTNLWVGNGFLWVYDGTGFNQTPVISASNNTQVTVAGWDLTGGQVPPESGSKIILMTDTGKDSNPPNNFDKMATYGGFFWGAESNKNFLHFWSETTGTDAEGSGITDANVVQVGPKGRSIVNLYPHNNQLWAFRQDGAWTIGEDGLAYHTLDFADQTSSLNFTFVTVWNGFLIFPVRNTLYKYRAGLQDITPPVWSEDPPYKRFGGFKGGVVRGNFLYVLGQSNVSNATDEPATETGAFVSLMATDGVGWHKLLDVKTVSPNHFNLWLDADSDYLYWQARAGTTGTLYRIPFQALSDLPVDSYPITGDHNWYSSYFDFGMRRIPKSFSSLTLHGRYPTGTTVVAQFRLDTTTAWTTLGTFTTDFQEIAFPAATKGKRVQVRLNLKTTIPTATPYIKAIIIKLMMRPDVLYGVSTDVLISDNLSDQNRLMLGLTAVQIRAALKSARASVSPITLRDIYGNSAEAYLASLRFVVVEYEDADAVQAIARCTFVFV
jgi:hypothetical protein